jgi:protein tyrosine phosphatase (PTP) superfamily phosphohydrolase (DUF442 family)
MTAKFPTHNFAALSDQYMTGGQPLEHQFADLQSIGVDLVIHIQVKEAVADLENAQHLVESNGMLYETMEASFAHPSVSSMASITSILKRHPGKRIYAYCAAGYCALMLLQIYRVRHEGLDPAKALRQIYDIWMPNPVWKAFLDEHLVID